MNISVILPTYRPGEYIWQCLDSLLRQTMPHDLYEVIIVLNGCNEPYNSRLSAYISGVGGKMLIRYVQTNQSGVSNARNIGLSLACGEYIAFVDDDDWLSDNYLTNLYNIARQGIVAVANVCNVDEETGQYLPDYLAHAFSRHVSSGQISLLSGRSFLSNCPCKIIPRHIIGDSQFDVRFSQSEDALFMATVSKRIEGIILASPDTIYYRRTRKGSVRHKRPWLVALGDTFVTANEFVRIYLTDIKSYNWLFFVTRILGLVKNLFRFT